MPHLVLEYSGNVRDRMDPAAPSGAARSEDHSDRPAA